ncbi:uncharacterized protein LOC110466180 isoform X2 [Mizuhopecten yessoensis]|uniref:uncharacterized protein LOC110466180 isoform X2 n=1 Tax=Mizuhopecten yessoensis TaxID=6573 RepID=UPI000B45A544|nr:uncharacterized protein LOC110466180 isoform X2 [Mizuhopecten yessoensis]
MVRNNLAASVNSDLIETLEDDDDDGELDEVSLNSDSSRSREPQLHTWPTMIGVVQLCNGFITAILGTLEIFVIPLVEHPDDAVHLHLGKDNCYGAGVLAGFFMILTGSTGIRASISRRPTSVRKFFNLTLFTLVLYMVIMVVLILGYALDWTKHDQYKEDSSLYEIHIFVTISTILGFLFCIAAFIQYYETVFFGNFQLCRRWMLCLCPSLAERYDGSSDSESLLWPSGAN